MPFYFRSLLSRKYLKFFLFLIIAAQSEVSNSVPLRTAINDALKLAENLKSESTNPSVEAALESGTEVVTIGEVPDVVPKATTRKSKLAKMAQATPVVFVSIGNTPDTVNRHNKTTQDGGTDSRSGTLKSTHTTNSVASPLSSSGVFPSSRSGTLTSNKSVGSSTGPSDPDNCTSRVPDGMLLREFMPRIRYPSLPATPPPDEFSSQGSDREYQHAINTEVAHKNLVNQQSVTEQVNTDYVNTKEVTDAAVEATAAQEAHQTSEDQNPISAIGFYATQPPPADSVAAMGRCKALYDYDANMYDELTIKTGKF